MYRPETKMEKEVEIKCNKPNPLTAMHRINLNMFYVFVCEYVLKTFYLLLGPSAITFNFQKLSFILAHPMTFIGILGSF
jgi:hypothetical protein